MTIWNIPPTASLDKLLECYEPFFVTEMSRSWYVNTWLDWGRNTSHPTVVMLKDEWVLRNRSGTDMGCFGPHSVLYLYVADEDARSLVKRWANERQELEDKAEKIK